MTQDLLPDTPTTPNGTHPTRLCALDMLFSATGEVEVKVGARTITLPIQSVDVEAVQALVGKPPRAPMFIQRVNGVNERVRDLADATYMDTLEAYNRKQMLAWICMGIAMDICDMTGKVVWSADNAVHDLDGARMALKQLGIVDNQILCIFKAIQALTDSMQTERLGD